MNQTPDHKVKHYRALQWRMLLVTMFCYLFYYTGRQNFGWAVPGLMEDLNLSPAELGLIHGAMLACYGIGQAVVGNMSDSVGSRVLVPLGAFLSFGLNWAISFAGGFGALITAWALNGFVQSFGFAPGGRLIANWWPMQERGRAFGFYLLAAGCSSLLTYSLCIAVLSELGWRNLFRIPVVSMLLGGVVFYLLARNRPEDLGFPGRDRGLVNNSVPRPAPGFLERYAGLLAHRGFLLGCLTIGLESTARYGLLTWTPLLFLGAGWKNDSANLWINLLLPLGMAVGALSCGLVSDRFFGSNRPIPVALFLAAGALVSLLLFFLENPATLVVGILLFLAGFLVFGPQASLWALCPDLLGRSQAGTAIGLMDACAYAFAALSGPLYGLAIQITGETGVVFVLNSAACALGACAILVANRFCQRGRPPEGSENS